MKTLEWRHLKPACMAMWEREQNHGCWKGGEIPPIMYEIRDTYYPSLKDDDMWLGVIEAVVKTNAVNAIGKVGGLRPVQR